MKRGRVPAFGITKDEHDELTADRKRPLTQDPVQLRGDAPPPLNTSVSIVDEYAAGARREARPR